MPVDLKAFTSFALDATHTDNRSVFVQNRDGQLQVGEGVTWKQRHGFDKQANKATMKAFRECLKEGYGVLGEHAFDSILGKKADTGHRLRTLDILAVMTVLTDDKSVVRAAILKDRFKNEVMRQVESNPRVLVRGNGADVRQQLMGALKEKAFRVDLLHVKTQDDITGLVANRLNTILDANDLGISKHVDQADTPRPQAPAPQAPAQVQRPAGNTLTMGLNGLDGTTFGGSETSVEDLVHQGHLGAGMRINKNGPGMVLEKLKQNGVEPGFTAHRDWSPADTREMMTQGTELDRAARLALEAILKRPLKNEDDVQALKNHHFAAIRDAIESGKVGNVKRLTERLIVKLDYNEWDRHFAAYHDAGSTGSFKLPVRNKSKGFFYYNFRVTSADDASVGAVAEAMANDLTRAMGIDTQELTLVKGQYSDGHDKLMLVSKFAEGYRDFDGHFIKDGRLVPQTDANGNVTEQPEDIGRYKAMFLLLADRDAVGSHGQNKGLINGKFFAIDPGHSLEGNGKDLEIHDDFSFVDKGSNGITKRFLNYSVFDDCNRSEKLKGMAELRAFKKSGKFEQIFTAYRNKFQAAEGDSEATKALKGKIRARIAEMKSEFDTQLDNLLGIFGHQLDLRDAAEVLFTETLRPHQTGMGDKLIDAVENLERLNSPTTDTSANGQVALKHLEVIPKTRVPWKATILPPNSQQQYSDYMVIFSCDKTIANPLKDIDPGAAQVSHPRKGEGTLVRIPARFLPRFLEHFTEDAVKAAKNANV